MVVLISADWNKNQPLISYSIAANHDGFYIGETDIPNAALIGSCVHWLFFGDRKKDVRLYMSLTLFQTNIWSSMCTALTCVQSFAKKLSESFFANFIFDEIRSTKYRLVLC